MHQIDLIIKIELKLEGKAVTDFLGPSGLVNHPVTDGSGYLCRQSLVRFKLD
jgi:hypothetical protein